MQKISLVLLRVSIGWMFFYAGITKVLNPEWTAEGYLKAAKTFPGLYAWFASPSLLPYVDFVNKWGLTIVGALLIVGLFVRWGSYAGALLMALYYFPILNGAMPNAHSFIVDEHVIYFFVFAVLANFEAGKTLGIDGLRRGA